MEGNHRRGLATLAHGLIMIDAELFFSFELHFISSVYCEHEELVRNFMQYHTLRHHRSLAIYNPNKQPA